MKPMQKRNALWLGALGACLLAMACSGGGDAATPTPALSVALLTSSGSVTPRAVKTPLPSPTARATPLQVCAPNPDPAPVNVLQIQGPLAGQQVTIPIFVRGWGSTIGLANKGVVLSVVDQKQSVVQTINLPPQPRDYRVPPPGLDITDNTRPFAADIVIADVTEPTPYCLWVYLNTDDQGHARQVVQVPVVIGPRS
jgi:hypothetical protein